MNFKKYLQFTGTISGTNYLLRNLFSFIVSVPISQGIFVSIYKEAWVSVFILSLLYIPILVFSTATIWKRANAIFPDNKTTITTIMVTLAFCSGFILEPISNMMSFAVFVIGLILIFKNSGIEEHLG
jgi:uncharacterized membrane protein YhaH (DUF805 family)